ncbi:MAG TPA: septum formation family protein [Acidimicrobiia bacterium]|nr:septum formation family protein [Acidimicrobiia bacterium]
MRRSLIALLIVLGVVTAGCDSGRTSVLELGVGDCFNDEGLEDEITVVPTVACSEPHDLEVYFAYSMTNSVYPGLDAALNAATQECFEEFEPFVGLDYFESELDFFSMVPTQQSWDQGDREVLCSVYAIDQSKLTGSMRNAQR